MKSLSGSESIKEKRIERNAVGKWCSVRKHKHWSTRKLETE